MISEETAIRGAIHISSEIRAGRNWENQSVVEFRFFSPNNAFCTTAVTDRPTAARMIRQLRRALDHEDGL